MSTIEQEIKLHLSAIEKEHQIRIPIAVESGSRTWGFASPNSDYDCRFIYVRPEHSYLTLFPPKDTLDFTPDAVFDLSGWDVSKVIQHLVKSNAVMLEWLQSELQYRNNCTIHAKLYKLGQAFFNPVAVCWHYLSMAKRKLAEIADAETAKIKAYCYVMRPLAAIRYIQKTGEIPFMEFHRNFDAIDVPDSIRRQVDQLLELKRISAESEKLLPDQILIAYFAGQCKELEQWLLQQTYTKNNDYQYADQTFLDVIKEAWQ